MKTDIYCMEHMVLTQIYMMQLNVRFQKNFMQKKLCTTSQKFFWLLPKLALHLTMNGV